MLKMSLLFQSLPKSLLAKADAGQPCREINFDRSMRIGILGSRGIPNAYGGFEQFAQYLSRGLVQRGHSVWVYNSSDHPYREKQWEGVHIIHCKDWDSRIGSAGQFIYDYNCLKDARRRDFDVLLQLGYTSNSVWHRLWPTKTLNVINMDGLEWKRSKYGPITRKFLFRAERWAARHGDILVADSIAIRDHIEKKYLRPATYIPYGAEIPGYYDAEQLWKWGLRPDGYFLLMARMEPENNIEMIIRGWLASGKKKPLVLIGNTGNSFGRRLQKTYRDEKLLFIGANYEARVINALRHYSSLYFHGHSVGGTNPSLLEAMACGCAILAHDNSFNKEILGNEAGYFSSAEDITRLLENLPGQEVVTCWKKVNAAKIRHCYTWDTVVEGYLELFLENVGLRREVRNAL
jgi:glycosyltransferase involved in cell wall biosynthesis